MCITNLFTHHCLLDLVVNRNCTRSRSTAKKQTQINILIRILGDAEKDLCENRFDTQT